MNPQVEIKRATVQGDSFEETLQIKYKNDQGNMVELPQENIDRVDIWWKDEISREKPFKKEQLTYGQGVYPIQLSPAETAKKTGLVYGDVKITYSGGLVDRPFRIILQIKKTTTS